MNNKYFEEYSKRIKRINFLILCFSFFLIANFFTIQLTKNSKLESIISKHGYKTKNVIGQRGKILDRNNKEIATSINKYTFWVNTNKKYDKNLIIDIFSNVFNKDKEQYNDILTKKNNYVVLEKNITETLATLILDNPIKGLRYTKHPSRLYKYDHIASHVVGYIGENNIGILGIEESCNNILAGDTAKVNLKKSAKGKFVNTDLMPSIDLDGHNIHLTINVDIQKILQEELYKAITKTEAMGANGIIINPYTGEIYALASLPNFNPNKYYNFEQNHFINAVISNEYEPGSTIKIIPVSIVLENNIFSLEDSIFCENGKYLLANNKYLPDHEEHGFLTLSEILMHSSNIGISKLSDKIPNETIYKSLKRFGFGSKTYLPLNNESKGKIRLIEDWSKTSKNYISIGQEFSINNLQLAFAYAAVANSGNLMKPQIIKEISKKDSSIYNKEEIIRVVLNQNIANLILSTLEKVVLNGTANGMNMDEYNIAGKTGTAQKFKNGKYSEYISTFVSIFPSNKPEYVMVVSIDEPKYGNHWANLSAVPATKEIIKRMIVLDKNLHKNMINHNHENIAYKNSTKVNTLSRNSTVYNSNVVPSFIGKSLSESLSLAKSLGIKLQPHGISGKVVFQSLRPGTKIIDNVICEIKMKI